MPANYWPWIGFNVFVLIMLALDLGVFKKKADQAPSFKEAVAWCVVWVSLAVGFAFLLWRRRALLGRGLCDAKGRGRGAGARAGAVGAFTAARVGLHGAGAARRGACAARGGLRLLAAGRRRRACLSRAGRA